jgi:general L-amino acid transport system permease protein
MASDDAAARSTTVLQDAPAPPAHRVDARIWMRKNLFSSPFNTLLTLTFGPLVVLIGYQFLRFVLVTARWEVVERNLTLFMVGTFPRDQLWRLWLAMGILSATAGLTAGVIGATTRVAALAAGRPVQTDAAERIRRLGPPAALAFSILIFARTASAFLLSAAIVGAGLVAMRVAGSLPARAQRLIGPIAVAGTVLAMLVVSLFGGVPRAQWGGLLITTYYTIAALVISYPIGIAFALGRRSTLPLVRWVCTLYIEFFRGSPLITLLFTGWLVLPFFLPPGFPTPGLVTRALVVFVLFTSAYVAEIVRGGLQSVGRGQIEAAQALGLSPWKQTRLVVLPQALRAVIPGLVGQAISLFKDTTLVLIIGQTDLLAVAQIVTKQDDFLGQGYIAESLMFVAVIYWIASYWMSRESQRLEARLGVGVR